MEVIPYEIIEIAVIKVNINTRRVYLDGEERSMRRKEFDILILLTTHPEWVYTKEQIFESVWTDQISVDVDNTVSCQMKNLKRKLGLNPAGQPYIETVWGVGYRFNPGI